MRKAAPLTRAIKALRIEIANLAANQTAIFRGSLAEFYSIPVNPDDPRSGYWVRSGLPIVLKCLDALTFAANEAEKVSPVRGRPTSLETNSIAYKFVVAWMYIYQEAPPQRSKEFSSLLRGELERKGLKPPKDLRKLIASGVARAHGVLEAINKKKGKRTIKNLSKPKQK